jgi:NitT/TauT family transport system substrate-binding protein
MPLARCSRPAKAVGIDPNSLTSVNISPRAKIPSLKSCAVDIISDFYNEHELKVRDFGKDLGFLSWRDIGVNPYGNSVQPKAIAGAPVSLPVVSVR